MRSTKHHVIVCFLQAGFSGSQPSFQGSFFQLATHFATLPAISFC